MNLILPAIIIIGLLLSLSGLVLIYNEKKKFEKGKHGLQSLPAFSILKPLKGADNNLYENMKSFFELEYKNYEIIFAVKDFDDSSIPIIRKLQKEYSHIDSKLVINSNDIGLNPKVNNLHHAMRNARYDYLIVSDSNVKVKPDYIQTMLFELKKPNVELVTSVIKGVGGSKLGSIFENLHLNGFIVGSAYFVSQVLRIPVSIGKSMCFRRSIIEQLGGWKSFSNYLIEDALIGKKISELGYSIGHCFDAVENINGQWSIYDFFSRHLRWGVMRKKLGVLRYLGEIVGNPVLLASVNVLLFQTAESKILLSVTVLSKIMLDYFSSRLIGDRMEWYNYLLVPIKDFVIGLIWICSLVVNRVVWRKNTFLIEKDTYIVSVNGNAVAQHKIPSPDEIPIPVSVS